MTDPNQPETFISKKTGKKYRHYSRHRANERQVSYDICKKNFQDHHGREMTYLEIRMFKTGFNMGYKEGKRRATQKTSKENKDE